MNLPLSEDSKIAGDGAAPSGPSASYCADVWNLGRLAVRLFPASLARWFSRFGALAYRVLRPKRKEVIIQNILPAFDGDRQSANRAANVLFRNFAAKLVDLWLFEIGKSVPIQDWSGWEHFTKAQAQKKGLLLVTAHLGNWELGAPFLKQRGFNLLVLTQAEPKGLTELRQASRARWGIETLVVGDGAFAFVEIIKRLQAGATIALIIDRPPPATEVTVTLFGKPFGASIAVAELARASGCAVLPVYIVQGPGGYVAKGLPEIEYDRQALNNRESRRQMTQKIVSALEPAIRQHADQWYNFIPIWK
jgi:KDO2-lipid IV(A) lauroyltransferase